MAVASKTSTFAEHRRRGDISLACHAVERAIGVSLFHDDERPIAQAAIEDGWSLERCLQELEKAQAADLDEGDLEDDDDDEE
jgi:hypothetical protein